MLKEDPKFYTPVMIRGTEYEEKWQKDISSLAHLYPQGMLIDVCEEGTIEEFILKCKERLCGRAQLETALKTKEVMAKYIEEYSKELLEKKKKVELRIDEIDRRQDVLKNKETLIKQKQKDLKKDKQLFELKKAKSFWSGVLQSLLASLILAVISIIILLQTNIPSSFIDMLASRLQQK